MNILLTRNTFSDASTIGQLKIEDVFSCVTLEPPLNGVHSAIPEGKYEIASFWSDKFKKLMPHVLNVPNRSHIEIHTGNYPVDTEGCILLGKSAGQDILFESTPAWEEFNEIVNRVRLFQKIYMTITSEPT